MDLNDLTESLIKRADFCRKWFLEEPAAPFYQTITAFINKLEDMLEEMPDYQVLLEIQGYIENCEYEINKQMKEQEDLATSDYEDYRSWVSKQ